MLKCGQTRNACRQCIGSLIIRTHTNIIKPELKKKHMEDIFSSYSNHTPLTLTLTLTLSFTNQLVPGETNSIVTGDVF